MTDQNVAEPAFKHTLRDPIPDGKGATITEISFRKPRAGDIMRCGNPVKYMPYDDRQDVAFDEVKLVKMLAALSDVLPPMIERMDPNDFMECAWGIASFFIPGMRRDSATS